MDYLYYYYRIDILLFTRHPHRISPVSSLPRTCVGFIVRAYSDGRIVIENTPTRPLRRFPGDHTNSTYLRRNPSPRTQAIQVPDPMCLRLRSAAEFYVTSRSFLAIFLFLAIHLLRRTFTFVRIKKQNSQKMTKPL